MITIHAVGDMNVCTIFAIHPIVIEILRYYSQDQSGATTRQTQSHVAAVVKKSLKKSLMNCNIPLLKQKLQDVLQTVCHTCLVV